MTIEQFAQRLREEFRVSMGGQAAFMTSWRRLPEHRQRAWLELASRVLDLTDEVEVTEKR